MMIVLWAESNSGQEANRTHSLWWNIRSLNFFVSAGTSDKSNLELITLTCTCVAATLFWLLLTLFIRKLKRVRTFTMKFCTNFYIIVLHSFRFLEQVLSKPVVPSFLFLHSYHWFTLLRNQVAKCLSPTQ